MALTLPPCLLGLFGLSAAYRIHASNRAQDDMRTLTLLAAPVLSQRILIVAPHCDDETLGAAGLMRQARAKNVSVRVVIVTNGDGFRAGVSRTYHELNVKPRDYIQYAYHRQDETRAALGVLGVAPADIAFLGFPDRGLMPLWTTNWASPFTSSFTQTSRCPYNDAPTPNAPYTGASLLESIKAQMRAARPTDIYVTHPNDDHPDHAAASVFVRAALQQLKADGEKWAQTARLRYYLVHRGDWPVPQGLHEDWPLAPPGPMAALDTHWEQFPLSKIDTQKKYAAIKRYESQTQLTGRFLFSFARRNELFGTLDNLDETLPRVADGQIQLDGDGREWKGIAPAALDPAGDTVARAFQASADVTRVLACRDSRRLFLRLDTRARLSPRVRYAVTLRPVADGKTPPSSLTLSVAPRREGRPFPVPNIAHAWAAWHGATLELSLPLADAGLTDAPGQSLYIGAETRFADLAIDRTGFRGLAVTAPAARTARR